MSTSLHRQVFVVINVTAFNDYQKEQQFRALKAKADEGKAVAVIRDGQPLSTDVRPEEVVVGDVVDVKAGDVLGADGILIEGTNVTVDESVLTGESKTRAKDPVDVPWLFSGTSVQTGQGKMLVTAVGVNSAEGAINTLVTGSGDEEIARIKAVEETLQLPRLFALDQNDNATTVKVSEHTANADRNNKQRGQRDSVLALKLQKLAMSLGIVAAVVAFLCFLGLTIRLLITTYGSCAGCDDDGWSVSKWREIVSFVITAITVLVVAIPEGLPLAVTISLAYSVRKMQKDMCLVRVLASCETMGNAQCICSDKTGTLTQNKMSVQALWINETTYGQANHESDFAADAPLEASKELPVDLLLGVVENAALNSSHKSLYVPKVVASTGKGRDPKRMSLSHRVQASRDYVATSVNDVDQVGSKTDVAILLLGDFFHNKTHESYVTVRDAYVCPS